MEESVREVLYETRYHASRLYSPNYPPRHQQLNDGAKGSFLSILSTRGVSQLREKWSEYKHPQKLRKLTSLFISPNGERVAIAAGNQLTILQKDDDYREPCGIFTGSDVATFSCGTWSEAHDILGITDDTDTVYFVKANGEEITRVTKRHLKVSSSIIGLILLDDSDIKQSCLSTFSILTSDGSLHDIEISQDPSASISLACTSSNGSMLKKRFPQDVCCLDYHQEVSLLAVVSSASSISLASSANTGSCTLSLWRRSRNLDLEPVFSTKFQGLYLKPKGYVGRLTSPKVLFSPHGKFVATLDLRGCLVIFKLDEEHSSLSEISCGERYGSQVTGDMSSGESQPLTDIVDFTWWSDSTLTVAKRSGSVTMLDTLTGIKLFANDPVYSMPILERAQYLCGHFFLLESKSRESCESSYKKEAIDLHMVGQVSADKYNQFEIAKLIWTLISFAEKSVPEMFDVLIGDQKYEAALEFADHHRLDKDEVLKAQWSHSKQGLNEIDTFLSKIKDQSFVLSECVNRIGPTEEAVRALLAYGFHLTNQYTFSESEDESSKIWKSRLARLKLLQFRDRLETFLGINMGRFSVQEYNKFRTSPINEVAVVLAENGKIGALNLLFKRHPYSLTPSMMEILAAIPETIPVQTYGQLLPGSSPPGSIALREEDWVECEKVVTYINKLPENEDVIQMKTEPIMKLSLGILWPSVNDLSKWYKKRARDIDMLSGQLDNCLCLVDFASRKGIYELEHFLEDISYLHQLIYSDGGDDETNFTMSLIAWEQLSDYEKFKMILKGVKEENVLQRLRDKAIPFMRNRFRVGDKMMDDSCIVDQMSGSFLVRWLKEISLENKVDICLLVIEEGCKELQSNGFFVDEAEAVNCALQCIYSYSVTDRWHDMASILSMLPLLQDSELSDLKKRLKRAEGHIEAGRLLAFYQVPKPISFFMEAHSDSKGVKQILRLMLSKFIRRQPSRSDNDWANMWHDLQSLQEKAFPFLDLEYLLMEFCRGLLKAGKFSLARNYLKGIGSVALATDKAENLVIQAAREYFFSASSLACSEIWKAKECLNIFPSSRNVRAEADVIDAVTSKLPNLGVNLLPVQFRQIKDPMEIIKLAIINQGGAYVNVDELIEIAKLLGLSSHDDISAVQEAIAREAAVAGDLQLAFDMCLVLAKKGHGAVWDLCAALARGPALVNMDISSRKHLLGFALSHCDEESIGELLHAWKDLDMQGQCEKLRMLTGTNPPNISGQVEDFCDDEVYFNKIKGLLSSVAKNISTENGSDWESLRENGKVLSFAALQLPWLIELIQEAESSKKVNTSSASGKQHMGVRTQAVVTTLSWLADIGFAPRDDLIVSLVKSIIEPPVTEEEDILGSSFLLNLIDAFHGVEIIEEQVRTREDYSEICSIMNVGMIYSLLHNSGAECEGPAQRRQLMRRKFQERNTSLNSDERDMIDQAHSSFWREWKLKLEEQKRVADHTRVLEQIIPGVETARFLSGDIKYMESSVLSLIESVKLEKKRILKDLLKLASTYGLDHTKVLLQYLDYVLVSEVWAVDDIMDEISEYKDKILACAPEAIKTISFSVYPAIDGHDKQRLAYIYSLLSDCYLHLEKTNECSPIIDPNSADVRTLGLARFYKIVEQECCRVSFIKDLNFKNIAGLQGLNLECFSSEIYAHIDEYSVEALAKMVQMLAGIYGDSVPEALVSWQHVYKHHVLSLLTNLESRAKTETQFQSPENLNSFISELEQTYSTCRSYIIEVAYPDVLHIMKKFFTGILPFNDCIDSLSWDSTRQDCLIVLLSFWLRLAEDMQEFKSHEISEEKFSPECLMSCVKAFVSLVMGGEVSPSQGWGTVVGYAKYGLAGDVSVEIFIFCRAMVFSGCHFKAIAELFTEVVSQFNDTKGYFDKILDLPHLYTSILESVLQDLASGILEHKNLHHLLSSLSKLEGDLEDLKRVRHTVWAKMTKFSDNLQIPSHARVYALEVMQFIAATGRNSKAFSAELEANVVPWVGWDSLQSTTRNSETIDDHRVPNVTDASSRFEITLVALKSSQLASAISPSIEVSADDLSTVESAVSCFLKLCGAATSKPHFNTLLAILGEWEGLFTSGRDEEATAPAEASDAGNNWSNDDWDEGWGSFQEEPVEKEEPKKESTSSVHPLHVCWVEMFKNLVLHSRSRDVIKLIDQSIPKTTGMLVDEDGAHSLSQVVLDVDCFSALKIALLLPYKAIQLQCLDVVEEKLKQGRMPDMIGGDHEFLVLVLSSGIISTIVTSSSYGTTFSYLCCLVGNFCHKSREAQLLSLKQRGTNEDENNRQGILFLFRRTIFPCFISELVKADQQILAGVLVTKFMLTNASLSLVSVAEATLRRYLEMQQLQVLQGEEGFTSEAMNSTESLVNTISSLRERLMHLFQSALASLSTSVR